MNIHCFGNNNRASNIKLKDKAMAKEGHLFFFFLAALGFHCCIAAFASCGKQGLLFVAAPELFIAMASPVAEHQL